MAQGTPSIISMHRRQTLLMKVCVSGAMRQHSRRDADGCLHHGNFRRTCTCDVISSLDLSPIPRIMSLRTSGSKLTYLQLHRQVRTRQHLHPCGKSASAGFHDFRQILLKYAH